MQQQPEPEYAKAKIYPLAQFVPPDKTTGQDYKVLPKQFKWNERRVSIDRVLSMMRGPATKAGGHGYKYSCAVSWRAAGRTHTQLSTLWFDPRRLEWFVEVPQEQMPVDWDTAGQVDDAGENYEN